MPAPCPADTTKRTDPGGVATHYLPDRAGEPGRGQVEELIAAGEVGTILPWDPRSPVRYEGMWWQPPLDFSTDAYLPVEGERAEMFERMWRSMDHS